MEQSGRLCFETRRNPIRQEIFVVEDLNFKLVSQIAKEAVGR